MQVTPIIPKAVADEQILVYVPVGQTGLAGILRPSPADFSVSPLGLLTIIAGDIVENGTNYVRSGVIYEAFAERDAKITQLQEDVQNLENKKQDKAIDINGISAKTVEGALAEIKGNTKDNAYAIQKNTQAITTLQNSLGDTNVEVARVRTIAESAQADANTAKNNAATALATAQDAQAKAIKASEDVAALQETVDEHTQDIADLMTKDGELEGKKQDKAIDLDGIAAKTVEGAIVEVNTKVENNATKIDENSEAINKLEQAAYGGETPIGTYPSAATLPTDAQLTAFVQEKVSRAPKLGDVVLFTQIVTGDTDKSYKFMYTASGWSNYVIPTVESASNTDKGIIQGTLNDASGNIQVSIVAGKVADILVKDGTTFKSIKALFDGLATSLAATNATVASNKTATDKTIADNKALADQGIAEAKAAAAAVIKKLNDVTFTFVTDSDTTMSKFPCKYTAEIAGVTVANVVDVYLSAAQIPLEIFSSYVQVETGKVSIFATTKANYPTSLTVPTVRIS